MIALGSDHAGYELKELLKKYLLKNKIEILDLGTYNGTISVDYPDYGEKVAIEVASGNAEKGILICGTGLGMAMCANKVKGVFAGTCHNVYSAERLRKSNDAYLS